MWGAGGVMGLERGVVVEGGEGGEGGCWGSYPGRLGEQQYAGGGWLVLLSWARRQLGPWVPHY